MALVKLSKSDTETTRISQFKIDMNVMPDDPGDKFGELFLSLRSWRFGAINFLEVVLFNISKLGI